MNPEKIKTGLRHRLISLIETNVFQYLILTIIVLNAITLGMETDAGILAKYGSLLFVLDTLFISIFTIEIVLKIYAYRLNFFRNGWNIFDFVIVAVSILPFLSNLSVLRTLRILRALRLVSVTPVFRRVIQGFMNALSGLMAVGSMLLLVFYVSAVMATKFFGEKFPEFFGSLGSSFYSLFQIMTLESWSMSIVRPVMEEFPMAWIFFILFILSTTFSVLNLLIGIIVNSMQQVHEKEMEVTHQQIQEQKHYQLLLSESLAKIENALKEIKKTLPKEKVKEKINTKR